MQGSTDPLYRSKQWRKLSRQVLRARPVCELCDQARSKVVDHIEPISRRSDLALAQSNLWSLCPRCANKVTVMFDLPGSPMRYRADSGCDEQGHPLDRLHAWNQPDGRTPDIRSKRQLVDLLRRLPVRPIAQRPSLQPASRSGSAPRR